MMDAYELEERRLEIENRMRNLMWTVSGDYELDAKLDVESFVKNKYISLYDAIKQGAFAKYFKPDVLALYLVKKMYFGAEESSLIRIARLCVDAAAYPKISKERPGVAGVRRKACEAMLEHEFHKMNHSFMGRVKLAMLRREIYGTERMEKRIQNVAEQIWTLEQAEDTMDIIRVVDRIYNQNVDTGFEKKYGSLEQVLSVETEELLKDGWQEFLDEEMQESVLEQMVERVNTKVTTLEEEFGEEEAKKKPGGKTVVVLDQEAINKMNHYIQLNFGQSYLNELEAKRLNHRLCTGAHTDCSLYYTDGILAHPILKNAQYVNAKKQADRNRLLLHNNQNLVKRSVDNMTANLRRSLVLRNEAEEIPSEYGVIQPAGLWKIGRTEPGRLFTKIIRQNQSDFVVDILMDASGSQRDRASQVALQAYMISESLSNVGILHRVMSFCTFWDYTVMQRLREYDAPKSANRNIFNYTTSSNNRDGLAIRAAADSLMSREEENKILIVLSDGRPNDVIVNRPNSRNPKPYCGDYAVQDTAREVRRLRNLGIFVLGVFAGKEQDLAAEKKIFGKDFAYIRDIRNFSNVVSQYLQKLLDW